MKWTQVRWFKNFPNRNTPHLLNLEGGGDMYKGHLLILREDWNEEQFILSCWNIEKNSWSSFDIQKTGFYWKIKNLIVYKNFLLVVGQSGGFTMAILNLDNINLLTERSPQEKRMMSLFMSEDESDISFMVEDKTLHAHKEILSLKYQYFKNLFNSGMAESRQKIIKIPDCEYRVFQEFMRFLYCDEVRLDIDLACKLLIFAEKHLKDDLRDKCIGFLTDNVSLTNVYTLFDFARQHDISHLQTWCLNLFLTKIDMSNVSRLMNYLDQQDRQNFDQYGKLRDKVLDVLFTENYLEIYQNQKQNMQIYEDFIIRNIDQGSILKISQFLSSEKHEDLMLNQTNDSCLIEKCTNLKQAVFIFIQENLHHFESWGIKGFPNDFLMDYAKHVTEKINNYESKTSERGLEIGGKKQDSIEKEKELENNQESKDNNQSANKRKRGRKRKEPIQENIQEEKPILKQTKKTSRSRKNK